MKVRPLIGRLLHIGGRLHVNQPLLNFSERLRRTSWKCMRKRANIESDTDSQERQCTINSRVPPPPQKKTNKKLCLVELKWRNENCREILLINFMEFQDEDFSHQKLMRILLLMRSPSLILT